MNSLAQRNDNFDGDSHRKHENHHIRSLYRNRVANGLEPLKPETITGILVASVTRDAFNGSGLVYAF